MFASIRRSIARKLMVVVLSTTFVALLVAAIAMLAYDVRNYRSAWAADLTTQADILARVTAPALAFDDARAASENLASLRTRPALLAAAIYTFDGRLFASWKAGASVNAPVRAPTLGEIDISGSEISVARPVMENGELIGSVYIRARYELLQRLQDYALILAVVMGASLVVAALLALWMQSAFTRPILQITQVARDVMEKRDFRQRARRASDDEIGVLVDAFNDMLNEVGRRTAALEEANRVLHHEMAERRGAEQALRVADRRKDEFLATLAHELRNPLAPLTSGLEILRMPGTEASAAQRARDIMERQLRHMVRLIDDLLDVSRITTGKLGIRKSRVALQTIIASSTEAIASAMAQKRHTLEVEMPNEQILLDADATRLVQVFFNLLGNAAKYTPAGGRISLRAVAGEDMVRVAISDNGIGLSPDMTAAIFDMFVQADQSLERSNAGLGVGLTLARRLTDLHGGTLTASSEGAGRGSTFTVVLPRLPRETAAAPAAEQLAPSGEAACRVLLVDDNADFAESLASLLRGLGHTVLVVHDGADALRQAPAFGPDIAFVDIGLPGLNGYELARGLRTTVGLAQLMMVAVTGWGQEKDKALARDAGFDDHLVKPVRLETILALIHRMQQARRGRTGQDLPAE